MGVGTQLGSTWLDEVDARVRRAETSSGLRLCVLPKTISCTSHLAPRAIVALRKRTFQVSYSWKRDYGIALVKYQGLEGVTQSVIITYVITAAS